MSRLSSFVSAYIIRAITGADEALAHSSIRFGLGRFTTEKEVDFVTDKIVAIVKKLRDMSPLYEMVLEGIDLKSIDWYGLLTLYCFIVLKSGAGRNIRDGNFVSICAFQ